MAVAIVLPACSDDDDNDYATIYKDWNEQNAAWLAQKKELKKNNGFITTILMILCIGIGISSCIYKCIKEFGGISGDVSGFSLVVGELLGLIGFCIL